MSVGLPEQANVTLDQFWVIAALDRLVNAVALEAAALKQLNKPGMVEKLETVQRHLVKHRTEYMHECKTGLVIASAGVLPDISRKDH